MGQLHSKANYIQVTRPLLNLSEQQINTLWESFNDVAEGFGINKLEMIDICSPLQESLGIKTRAEMDKITSDVFLAMDTDENGLVDALEFLGTMAIASAMKITEKITFVFNCYDFDESGQITIDELTLAMKSTLTGLCKVSLANPCPSEARLEEVAIQAFQMSKKPMENQVTLQEVLDFCDATPELSGWIEYYDSPYVPEDDYDVIDSDIEMEEHAQVDYTVNNSMVLNPEFQSDARFDSTSVTNPGEFASPKPWINTIANAVPSNPSEIIDSAPDVTLHLEWIYGYTNDIRNNIEYLGSGEILYPAAKAGIILDLVEHTQRYFMDHVDKITCMKVHPNREYVATGERGNQPRICIWNPSLNSTDEATSGNNKNVVQMHCLRGFHKSGIAHCSWSPNGKQLISVGLDDLHRIAIYAWSQKDISGEQPSLVFAEINTTEKVLACHAYANDEFVTCGVRHIFFWTKQVSSVTGLPVYRKKRGILGKIGKLQTFTCLASIQNHVLSGTIRGDIYIWQGRNCIQALRGHSRCITSLWSFGHGYVSGGKDGKVRVWSRKHEAGAQFDIKALGSSNPRVRTVTANEDGTKLLIGTAGGEVFEIAASDGCNLHFGPIVSAHARHELWGLATHPSKAEFCSVGDDQTIRIWDLEKHRLVRMTELDTSARCVTYSPDGKNLVVGLGAGDNREEKSQFQYKTSGSKFPLQKKEGAFAVLNEETLVIKYEARDSKKWIRDIKFSPDGETLGVASQDHAIYLYNAEDYASKGKCKKHTAFVSHFDFSLDSLYLQSNCGAHELLYFDATNGKEIPRAEELKDMDWNSSTSPCSWASQGLWGQQPFAHETLDIYATDRVVLPSASTSKGAPSIPLLASMDNFGRLRVHRYPCATKGSAYLERTGHCLNGRNVRFHAVEPQVLLSVGGEDRCIFQWRVFPDTIEDFLGNYEDNVNSEDEMDLIDGSALDRSAAQERANVGDYDARPCKHFGNNNGSPVETPIKPWVATAIAPTANKGPATNVDLEELRRHPIPNHHTLQLEFVHGYRGQDGRHNVFYNCVGDVVYPAATVGIVLNIANHTQTFFRGHTDDISCLTMHPQGVLCASGQCGTSPEICIWDTTASKKVIRVLKGSHRRAISALCFSSGDGKFLASAGQDDDHSIVVYDWRQGVVQARAQADGQHKIFALAFHPSDRHQFVSVGVEHIKFWTVDGNSLNGKRGLLGRKGLLQHFPCVAYLPAGEAVVGSANGQLYRFQGCDLTTSVVAHIRSVVAIHSCGASGLITGGKDGFVKIWTLELECTSEFNVADFHPTNGKIRAVCWRVARNTIVLGTRGGEIYEISSIDGQLTTKGGSGDSTQSNTYESNGALVHGHYLDEVRGLATHPVRDECCSVGDDKTLRVWDLYRRRQKFRLTLESASRAVAYSPDGAYIALGLGRGQVKGSSGGGKQSKKDGSVLVLLAEDLSVVHEARDTKHWITCIQYSQDGLTLAAGSYDNSIYLYDVQQDYVKRAVFSKHKTFVTHVDFSVDGQYIRSTCGAHELLYADAMTGSHVASASALKNQQWSTCNCVYSWEAQGIWPTDVESNNSMMVTSLARSHGGGGGGRSSDSKLLLSGDSLGRLKVFRYPCVVSTTNHVNDMNQEDVPYVCYRGHASQVSNVAWSQNDAYALSVSGSDRCVFQWRHIHDEVLDRSTTTLAIEQDLALELEGLHLSNNKAPASKTSSTTNTTKPYWSAMVPPTNVPQERLDAPPAVKLELEHVYGFRAFDCRQNLKYSSSGKIIYPAAALGVSYDREGHVQNFYRGHGVNAISSLAVSRDGLYVATGEVASDDGRVAPRVHLWEAASCQTLSVLPAFHTHAITAVEFSEDGEFLASVGQDACHSVAVWHNPERIQSWEQPNLLAYARNTQEKVLFVSFATPRPSVTSDVAPFASASATGLSREDDAMVIDVDTDESTENPNNNNNNNNGSSHAQYSNDFRYDLMSGGFDHVIFWKIDAPNLLPMRGIFGSKATIQAIPCGQLVSPAESKSNVLSGMSQRCVTGTLSGQLYVWEGRHVSRVIQAHTSTVNAMSISRPSSKPSSRRSPPGLVTGSQDHHVKCWSMDNLTLIADFDLGEASPMPFNAAIQSVDWDAGHHRILIGTRGSEIYELSEVSGNYLLVHEGHCHGELYALAHHPLNPDVVASGGGDMTLRLWSLSRRTCIAKMVTEASIKSAAWSPDGATLAIGYGASSGSSMKSGHRKDGAFAIVNVATMEIVHEGRESKQTISCLAYSPDGTILALGSYDANVYLHSVVDHYALRSKCDKATGPITSLDFSQDSSYVRVNSETWELISLNVMDGSWIATPATMKDVLWASESCVLQWATQGTWTKDDRNIDHTSDDEFHIHACAKAHAHPYLISGDNRAHLAFSHFPMVTKHAPYLDQTGHSYAVSNATFTCDDARVITTGNIDLSVCQWKITYLDTNEDEQQ